MKSALDPGPGGGRDVKADCLDSKAIEAKILKRITSFVAPAGEAEKIKQAADSQKEAGGSKSSGRPVYRNHTLANLLDNQNEQRMLQASCVSEMLELIYNFAKRLKSVYGDLPLCVMSNMPLPSTADRSSLFKELKKENPELVILPVHEGAHFSLILLDFRSHVVTYYDSTYHFTEEKAMKDEKRKTVLQHCLVFSKIHKRMADSFGKWKVLISNGGQMQNDGDSCGVRICGFALSAMLGVECTWINHSNVKKLRDYLKHVVFAQNFDIELPFPP